MDAVQMATQIRKKQTWQRVQAALFVIACGGAELWGQPPIQFPAEAPDLEKSLQMSLVVEALPLESPSPIVSEAAPQLISITAPTFRLPEPKSLPPINAPIRVATKPPEPVAAAKPVEDEAPKRDGRLFPEEKPIGQISVSLQASEGALPTNVAVDRFKLQSEAWDRRPWESIAYCWDAPVTYSRPLYYEQPNLERNGVGCHPCVQPVVSGAHFFASTLALPYSIALHHPNEHMYPLGHYRPGSTTSGRLLWPEWDLKAAAAETGAVAGMILLLP